MKKLSRDVTVEGMMDNIQCEWSTGLYNALSQLLAAVRRNTRTASCGNLLQNSNNPAEPARNPCTNATDDSQAPHQSSFEDPEETELMTAAPSSSSLSSPPGRQTSAFRVKFDLSNINLFVTNSIGGK